MEDISRSRIQHYNDYCAKHAKIDSEAKRRRTSMRAVHYCHSNHFSYSDQYKFVECRVPKTGTSARGRYMWSLFHHEPFDEEKYSHPFQDKMVHKLVFLPIGQVEKRLRSYTTFLFVRDPMVRFISGYRVKIKSQKMDRTNFVRMARKMVNETDKSKPLSFEGFAKYAAMLHDNGKTIPNLHFDGYFESCGKCMINYTFIGKFVQNYFVVLQNCAFLRSRCKL